MNKVKKFWEICREDGAVGAWFCLLTTIFLFIGAALCPPMFIIDKSILAAGGILFGFSTLWKLPALVKSIQDGKSLSISHGETNVTVSSKKEGEQAQ